MKFRLDRKTSFPRDAVFAWWTDFREDDHRHPGSPADSTRTILGRTENEVWLRDRDTRIGRPSMTVAPRSPGLALARLRGSTGRVSGTPRVPSESRRRVRVRPMHFPTTRARAPPSSPNNG